MGGRGSSSRSYKNAATSPIAKMSDRRLDSEIKAVEASMEKLSRVMAESSYGHTGYLQGAPFGSKAEHKAYVEAFDKYSSLRARRSVIIDEQAKRKHKRAAAEPREPKTFVNSFGEAAARYVTTPGYERAQKRLDKAVLRNMGY